MRGREYEFVVLDEVSDLPSSPAVIDLLCVDGVWQAPAPISDDDVRRVLAMVDQQAAIFLGFDAGAPGRDHSVIVTRRGAQVRGAVVIQGS